MTCDYIDSHKESFGVEPICTALCEAGVKIAPSTYYARKKRAPSKIDVSHMAIMILGGRAAFTLAHWWCDPVGSLRWAFQGT